MTPSGADPWRRGRPLAMAHRGQRATVPEQTLEAYRAAIQLGCEAIECDVQLTSDDVPVMLHDLTLDRTTDGHGPVAEHSWADVRLLDAGSWFDAAFAGARVPSLDETLELAASAGVPLCIEIKGTAANAARTAVVVAGVLRDRGLLDTMFVSSFDHAALAAAAEAAGRPILLAPERLPASGPSDPSSAVAQARAVGATVLQHRWEDLTAAVVDALHQAGIGVWSWPIDSLESIEHSVRVGVDAIIGDDVPLLLEGLRRFARPVAGDLVTS